MPVAEKKQLSPRDEVVGHQHLVEVVAGVDRGRCARSSLRGHSRPWISPPRHLSAAAAITPSGVPADAEEMSAPDSCHAVEIAPATSPSVMSRMRAPGGADLVDEVVVAVAVEDDRGQVAHRLLERVGERVEVLGRALR